MCPRFAAICFIIIAHWKRDNRVENIWDIVSKTRSDVRTMFSISIDVITYNTKQLSANPAATARLPRHTHVSVYQPVLNVRKLKKNRVITTDKILNRSFCWNWSTFIEAFWNYTLTEASVRKFCKMEEKNVPERVESRPAASKQYSANRRAVIYQDTPTFKHSNW